MFADIVRKPLYHILLSTDTCPRTITSPDKPLLFTILPSHAFSTCVVSFCIYLNASLYASFTPQCIKQHRVKLDINSFKRQLSDGYRIQSYKLDKKPDPKGTYRIPRMLRNLIESLELDRNDQTVNLKHRTLFLFLFSRAMFNRRMKRQVKFASKDPSLVA